PGARALCSTGTPPASRRTTPSRRRSPRSAAAIPTARRFAAHRKTDAPVASTRRRGGEGGQRGFPRLGSPAPPLQPLLEALEISPELPLGLPLRHARGEAQRAADLCLGGDVEVRRVAV